MIAKEDLGAAAGAPCLFFETHEQIHDVANGGAAIGEVSCLDEASPAAAPSLLRIDEACRLEDGDQRIAGAMHIANSDEPLPRCLRGHGARGDPHGAGGESDNDHSAGSETHR